MYFVFLHVVENFVKFVCLDFINIYLEYVEVLIVLLVRRRDC